MRHDDNFRGCGYALIVRYRDDMSAAGVCSRCLRVVTVLRVKAEMGP